MLLCGIIDQLLPSTKLENSENRITFSYFFCRGTNRGLSSSTAVLRGLIHLMVIQHPSLVSHLRDDQGHNRADWNSGVAIGELFRKMIAYPTLQETYLIIDALD